MDNAKPDSDYLVTMDGITVVIAGKKILDNLQLTIHKKEQWAIVGHSGSGKTTLAKVLAGNLFHHGSVEWNLPDPVRIVLVEQQHRFKNLSNTSSFYYQQRFNASESEDSLTVMDMLGESAAQDRWVDLLHLRPLLHKPVIQLSNGENKRLQIVNALRQAPAVLVLDNPFLGLDTEGRDTLQKVLQTIIERGIHVILITGRGQIPDFVTHVAVLEDGVLSSAQTSASYRRIAMTDREAASSIDHDFLASMPTQAQDPFSIAVKMSAVTIKYGDKTVLDGIDWEVKKGECWNVSGPNGAGKSTLLSLITADNPQAYANKIILFDRQRGSGESIWDIKKKIGFVSPELHLYFEQYASCFDVIASGLFDTIGLFRALSAEQEETVEALMRLMKLQALRNKPLFQLSASQQRMILLARALVKNPPLLILDEPAQGLDDDQSAYFKQLITEICEAFGTTLIYVSHYSTELPSCINHFLALDNGKIKSIQ